MEHEHERQILQSDVLWIVALIAGSLILAAVVALALMRLPLSTVPYIPLYP